MQDNEIYKFMKANGLTDKDEKTFLNEYSNPKKAKEVFNFFKANELTDKDETSFYDTYLKKKEPITSSVTPSQLPKISEQVSPLQQGANIVGGGVIGDISKAVPKEGTKKENDYFKQIAVGIKPSAQGDVVERIYENPMGVEVLQVEPKKREAAPQQPVQKAESKDKPLKGVKPIAPTKTELNEQGWLLNMVSAIDKGIYKTLGTTAQGAGTLLQGVTSKITGGTGEGFISDALIKFGDSYNKMIDELTPQDESFKGSLSDQVGQALGFVGGLALTGGASSVARSSSALMQQAPKSGALTSAVKELVKGTVSPTGVVGGLTMGQAEFDRAKQSGATDEQAFEAFYKNAAVGSVLERIPVMHFLKRFNQSTAGGVVNYIKTKGVAGLTGGVEEMTTEMLQQLYANKTAKDIYNTNQDLFEGVAGNSGIGFSVGFLLNAMGANAKILRKQGKVNEAKLVENQVKELQEKAKGVAPTNNAITTKIAVNGNEEGLQRTQAELDNDLQKGLISEEEYQEKALVAQKAAEVNAKIPDYVQGVNRAESIDLINERENLQQELAQKEEQKKSIDVAYHKSIDESNKEVQKRIDEINSQLGELAKPEKNIIKPNVRTESLEYGGSKYYITDNSGNEIGSAEVSTVDDKIIIDNLFVDEKNKRKGLATSILDKIIEDFKGRNYEYIDQNDVEFSIPYKIEVGTVVSEEGQAFSNSVRKKIEEFNKNQEKGVLPKEEVIVEEEIQQPIEQPQGEVVEAVRVEQEPEAKEGVKVVTLSGMVEGDRVKAVEERKKKTTLTEKETLHNDLIDLANRVQKSRGNEKTNLQGQIRQRVRELNANLGEEVYKYDGVSVRTKVKSKTKGERYLKIKGTTRDTSGRAIKEDAVLLFDRSPEFVQKYEQLADSPNITALQVDSGNGVTMTAEQIESALQDIADGIPSVQADNLLNALEEGFNRGYFDLRGKDIGQDRVQATVEDFIGVQQEEVGQPLDEEAMFEWLNEISELPQEEQIEIDNIILEYEQQPQQIDISGKIQSPKPESKEGSPTSTKPSKEGERNGKPKKEVSKQPIGEAEKQDVKDDVDKFLKEVGIVVVDDSESGLINLLASFQQRNKKEVDYAELTKKENGKYVYYSINKVGEDKAIEFLEKNGIKVKNKPKKEVSKQPIAEAKPKEDVEEKIPLEKDDQTPPPPTPPKEEGKGEEGGSKKQRRFGILRNLMKSEKVSDTNKKLLEENGLNYEVSSQPEAQQLAKEMVEALGVDAALDAARGELIDPSVGSAVFAESLNTLFNQENDLRAEGKVDEANAIAEKWADVSYEYAEISNRKGKWNSQIAYFYKTSPMGFVMRIQESRAEQFKEWFKEKEEGYKEVFDIIKESEEFADILKGEVEKSRSEERKTERKAKKQKVHKAIDDWADKWAKKFTPSTTQGKDIQQQGLGVPEVMKAAAELAKKLYDAGSSVANIVEDVALYVKEQLGENIDLDELKNSLTDLVGNFEAKENALVNSLKRRKDELERRIREKDFSSEEYKEKRELSDKEKEAKEQYEEIKKEYDEARKSSKEYIDKKAKQYLTQLRKRLSGLSEEKKEEIVRRSIKKIIDSGGLEYDDFKDIVSNVMGLGKLSPEQIKEIESLTEKANDIDQIELDYVQNPTKEGLTKFVKAKQGSLEANRKLFELTHNEADITGTVKSIMTLNLLNLATVTANYFQNAIYQGLVRFPTSVIVNGIEYGKYGASLVSNRLIGTKVILPQTNPIDAQKGYWKEYNQGLIRGWQQTIKGVDEKDYFSSNQYAANLNPLKSYRDLVESIKGDLQLSTRQKIDKFLQSTIGVQAYAISRFMTLGDKPPRYGAQGAEAMNIGTNELNLTNPLELEAFINAPERFSYNYFVKQGMSPKEAGIKSKELTKRIVDAGAKAVFQNENLLNFYLSKIDEASKLKEKDKKLVKGAKTFVSLGKAYTLPFVKTPANIWWAYFKVNNPALTFAKGAYELYEASVASKKGNFVEANRLRKQSNESFALAVIGYGFAVAAMALYQKGLVRPSNDDEDKAREKTAETFFGSDNKLNLGKFLGGDDYWVDLTWFPALGAVIDTQANLLEDKKKRGEDVSNADYNFLEDLLPNLKYSSIASLNSLVFDNGTRILDGIRKGGNYGENLLVDMVNRATGTVVGSTFQRASSLALPHKVDTKADGIMERISNSMKEKNAIVRIFTDTPKAKISIWGEPIKQDNSAFGILRTMFKIEKGSSDKFGLILYDDFQRTGNTKFLPPYEDAKITHNGKQVELNTEQKRDLDIFVGQARKAIIAPFISDAAKLDGFDNYYSKLSDSEKIDALDVLYKQAKKIGYAKFQEKYTEFSNAEVDFEAIMQDAEKEFKKKALEFSLSNQ